jgi:hypothetical protein
MKRLIGVIVGVLILAVSHVPHWPGSDHSFVGIAAAAGNTGGQGVSGQPQKKNGTIKPPPKTNPSISGSQIHRKH